MTRNLVLLGTNLARCVPKRVKLSLETTSHMGQPYAGADLPFSTELFSQRLDVNPLVATAESTKSPVAGAS